MKRLSTIGTLLLILVFAISGKRPYAVYNVTPDISLSTVSGYNLQPGDQVLFQRGGTWSGTLSLNNRNGAANNKIYIGAYGSGADPILGTLTDWPYWRDPSLWYRKDSITRPNTWTFRSQIKDASNVVIATYYTNTQDKSHRLWVNGVESRRARNEADVSSTNVATYLSSTYELWVYCTGNPATTLTSLQYPGEQTGTIDMYGTTHVTVEGLDVRGSIGGSIDMSNVDDITINNCEVGLNAGHIGIRAKNKCTNVTITNSRIKAGDNIKDYFMFQHGLQDGVALNTGCHNWTVWDNDFGTGWGHSAIEFTDIDTDTTGKLLNGKAMSNISILRNFASGSTVDYCRGLGLDSRGDHTTSGIVVRYNWFEYFGARSQIECRGADFSYNVIRGNINHGLLDANTENSGQGIMCTGYASTTPQDMTLIGNTITDCDEAGIAFGASTGYGILQNNTIENNIISNCGKVGMYGLQYVQFVIQINSGGVGMVGPNTWRNNLLYSPNGTNVFYDNRQAAGSQFKTVAGFNALNGDGTTGIVTGNIGGAPNLSASMRLQAGSPAIGAGYTETSNWSSIINPNSTWVGSVTLQSQASPWDLGAMAYSAGAPPPVAGQPLIIRRRVKTSLAP